MSYEVLRHEPRFHGAIFDVFSDTVAMPDGGHAQRDVIRHLGAAAVIALDADGTVTLVRQYRHPIGARMWQVPAGLLDVPGESGLVTAQRELMEEADLRAATWHHLVDLHSSPGYSDELVRVFLARDLTPVAEVERHHRTHEESEMVIERFDLDRAVAMAFAGEITDASTIAGLMATTVARSRGFAGLRTTS